MTSDADPRVETLARQFEDLSPNDQELVIALVNRLHGSGEDDAGLAEYPPDVSFMDFDQ